MNFLYVLLIVVGFAMQFLATFPVSPWCARIGWGCWLGTSLTWAMGAIGHG